MPQLEVGKPLPGRQDQKDDASTMPKMAGAIRIGAVSSGTAETPITAAFPPRSLFNPTSPLIAGNPAIIGNPTIH